MSVVLTNCAGSQVQPALSEASSFFARGLVSALLLRGATKALAVVDSFPLT